MRLSAFIKANIEVIIADWEAFARTFVPAGTMDIAGLRDHAREMLLVIARDLETPQTKREQSDKSKGKSDSDTGDPETPAQAHGAGRADSGFSFEQMVSEHRALRASVIHLWTEGEKRGLEGCDIEDLLRFNEAIDQALAESTSSFVHDLDQTRETFLGVLGHDLRSPLGAIITSARFMLEVGGLSPRTAMLVGTIVSSGTRMNRMVDDMLDFARSRLGSSIPVVRKPADLGPLLRAAVEELEAAHRQRSVRLQMRGDLAGEWDGARVSQVLSNLLGNAVEHGARDTPITVDAWGDGEQVWFSVHNQGVPIPGPLLHRIFDPMTTHGSAARDPDHLGLGLYIAERIVAEHGGDIGVESSAAAGTTFTVRLPRK